MVYRQKLGMTFCIIVCHVNKLIIFVPAGRPWGLAIGGWRLKASHSVITPSWPTSVPLERKSTLSYG